VQQIFEHGRWVRAGGYQRSVRQLRALLSSVRLCLPTIVHLMGSKRSDLEAVVAPLCIKRLRLVTVQLPEKLLGRMTAAIGHPRELRHDGVLRSSMLGVFRFVKHRGALQRRRVS
jgi:hypothetical protein